jgi:hypothetical protein
MSPLNSPQINNITISNIKTYENVSIICPFSESHSAEDHQENAGRTSVLCGTTGCLRRPALQKAMSWVDKSLISPAKLADLLR